MVGTRIAHYEITGRLGQGGMGEVYQATDSKLGRDVAIKVLPDAFARDSGRVARLEREARVLASLNHPGIGSIYGLEELQGRSFLVMELVAGETLADRIARGSVPLDEALTIAHQIAEALEAAHDKGVMHRDLKPSNIKITPDGKVKVLDFGLAKAVGTDAREASPFDSPTLTAVGTSAGVILGTAAYMSPEQARGLEVDRRTDVFAFGAVLYEMLTGRPAFQGDTVSDTLASVLKLEPDLSRLPVNTPPAVHRLLQRCLRKDRKQRLQTAGDARIEIADARVEGDAPAPAATRTRNRLAWILTAVFAIGVLTLSIPAMQHVLEAPPVEVPETRLDIVTPPTSEPFSFAIAPDGRRVVFAASSGEGRQRLWLRGLDNLTPQVLAGTEGAVSPFWSPDSRSIGFFADSKLKRLDLGGGSPLTMTNVSVLPRGATWSSDGVILFAPSASGSLYRVPASGGDVVAVTRLQPQHTSHRFPQFLPRTRQFLFYVQGATDIQGIYLGSLDSQDTKRLTSSETMGAYVPYGWLLFVRQGTLVARRFDPMRRELTSDPVTVADRVGFESSVNIVALSVANAGPITYRATGAIARQLNWFDRSGRLLGQFGARDENELTNPELSPDARRVAVNRTVQGNIDVFLMDSIRPNRLTFDAAIDGYPVWSPDGDRVAFRTNRKGIFDLFETSPGITGSDSPLVESSQTKIPTSWSRDGRFVLYYTVDPMTARDIWLLARDGDRKPFPFLNTRFDEFNGQFSHDGRWVAYESNESGQSEIYVRPFPVRAGQVQISTSGGFSARWRPDGKELYYVATDGMLMAVPITVSGATLEPGKPVPLFRPRMVTTTVSSRQQYDVTADGRFLINVTSDDATASPITVLQNWKPPVK